MAAESDAGPSRPPRLDLEMVERGSSITEDTSSDKSSPTDPGSAAKSSRPLKTPGLNDTEDDTNDSSANLTSSGKAFANTMIAFLGSGALGLPYAFSKTGILYGLITLVGVSSVSLYAMMLLVSCKYKLRARGYHVSTYGDIGRVALGTTGSVLVNTALVVSQTGFCVAYLIFIAFNVHSFLGISKEVVVSLCLPPLIAFSLLKHMKQLSPFALLADVLNMAGFVVVYLADLSYMAADFDAIDGVGSLAQVPFFFGVASYCFEGIGMVLPLENSMQHKQHFAPILSATVIIITTIYATFGVCGYLAFGASTKDVITLNMDSSGGLMVKLFLCGGLFFTYPLMLFPVFEVLTPLVVGELHEVTTGSSEMDDIVNEDEERVKNRKAKVLRAVTVLLTAVIAAGVPNFGTFISFIGSTCCVTLAFVLPSLFYLVVTKDEAKSCLSRIHTLLLIFIMALGLLAVASEVYDALVNVF